MADPQTQNAPASNGPANGPSGEQASLYAEHIKVQPRNVDGTFRRLKWGILGVLLAIYYIAPWLRWDRGPNAPDQAILLDIAGRRGYFFWIEIWPQEVYYLTGILILCAIGLFFVTALAGRVWCGFTCPQTVWTDLFMWVERLIEGDRNKRIILDRGPITFEKVWKKTVKHIAWLVISVLTGGVWVLYFSDAFDTVRKIFTLEASVTLYSMVLLFTGTTYVLAGWAREQVCIYMCPWPRFQAAMFDEESLIVTYEEWRGEPRGGAKKGTDFSNRGDCVDCTLCVQVCPTGIDIRDGQQMACIGCGLCIDACNSMMAKYDLPPNLITYDSINRQLAREKGQTAKLKLVRGRTIVYVVVLAIVSAIMIFSLSSRDRTEVNVIRDRAPLFVRLSDGDIRNGYTYKVLNMVREDKTYVLSVDGLQGAKMTIIGLQSEPVDMVKLPVGGDSVGNFRLFVTADPKVLSGPQTEITLRLIEPESGDVVASETVFAGPGR